MYIFTICILYIYIHVYLLVSFNENNGLYSFKETFFWCSISSFRSVKYQKNEGQELCVRIRETLKAQLSRT